MSSVLQKFEIGQQWPTLDPFLFTAHHNDTYPLGNDQLGPDPSELYGRQIGSDFSGRDGWSMYHGQTVPGFPQHPHRGFETITYVRRGFCDHTDSMGAAARFGEGDTQWVTTGSGVVHAEMFPLLNSDHGNHLELFQIWLNLPARDKMVPAYFTMLWAEETPKVVSTDRNGNATTLTLIAGSLGSHDAQLPPPN
ncbi:MAG: pirin family protein, partial [Acidimicrobiales bacterium]|nr:pirin family protein [Acidimicrobiales bacterium]